MFAKIFKISLNLGHYSMLFRNGQKPSLTLSDFPAPIPTCGDVPHVFCSEDGFE